MTPCPVCHRGFLAKHCAGKRCTWLRCAANPPCGALVDTSNARVLPGVTEPDDPEGNE